MPTRKVRNPRTGEVVDASVVEFNEEQNIPVKLRLDDGALLRLRLDVVEVVRVPDTYNASGEPLYAVRSTNSLSVVEPPSDHAP